ncbi:unnamed protein product, partial [Allacma fusca]
ETAHQNLSSKNRADLQDDGNDSADQTQVFQLVGGAIAAVIIILLVVLSGFLARKKNMVVVKNLSPGEVDGFILGRIPKSTGDHENIVKFLGAAVDGIAKGECLAVLELCPFGNLNSYLRKHAAQASEESRSAYVLFSDEMENQRNLSLSVLMHFCKQIATGMEYLAQMNVIHGDLATRNVLVFEKLVVKITDFGLSRRLYSCMNYKRKSQVPLPWAWMALESLSFKEFSIKSDVWSFGVTMW